MARLIPFRTGFVICNRIKSRGKILSMHTLGRSAIVTLLPFNINMRDPPAHPEAASFYGVGQARWRPSASLNDKL
jgi:hypothetical protein